MRSKSSPGVVLVSHDSWLKRSDVWVVDDGTVSKFQGSFKEYKADLSREIKAEADD